MLNLNKIGAKILIKNSQGEYRSYLEEIDKIIYKAG